MTATDHTEGGKYRVRVIRFSDGTVEIRRTRECGCGHDWDADLIIECPWCEVER